MAGEETPSGSKPPAAATTIRLVNFISEDQLDEAKRTRGERADDGTAQRDKPLFQILQENKEKKDAEFNERFKHRPPKALDEDEMEFLDKLASPMLLQHLKSSSHATFEQSRKEYEQQVANEEAEQLRSFQEAVAARSNIIHEEAPTVSRPEESKPKAKRSQPALLKNVIISVKPQAKKAKVDAEDKPPAKELPSNGHSADQKLPDATKGVLGSLVQYEDDESSDEDV
uniref:FAM192A/Fyv6 N-terminal domain-containing protein n=1 Tax=Oryza punctata TaxID=4537 RepID=A0A0E0JHU5_ORYPU